MSLQTETVPGGRVAVVAPRGELDVARANELRTALREPVGRGVPVVVVDLRGVTFVDSTILGVLVEVHRSLAAPRRLVVAGARGLPLRALQLTGLDGVLHLLDGELDGDRVQELAALD